MNKPRIIFMGTPEFAVASLDALVRENYPIVAVVTAPDKPAGRGMKITMSAVKQYALEKNIPVLQPEKLKDSGFLQTLKSFNADLQVVVAFRMLPEVVWNMPPLGTINVHASLLPKFRGAAPINWAVMNGDKQTGVTTFKLTHEIDTGNILLQKTVDIGDEENAGDLHDKLKIAGAELLVRTLEKLINKQLVEQPQATLQEATHAPKIFSETCMINWNKPAFHIHNQVRGLSPFPGAFTSFRGKTLKIFKTVPEIKTHDENAGNWFTDQKSILRFACSDGYIYVKELQLEGKKRMSTEEFLRGLR